MTSIIIIIRADFSIKPIIEYWKYTHENSRNNRLSIARLKMCSRFGQDNQIYS